MSSQHEPAGYRQGRWKEPPLLERGGGPSRAATLPEEDLEGLVPVTLRRTHLRWPDVAENVVVRHFTRLSNRNFGVDSGMYPLGSCTMKYNPKICDETVWLPGIAAQHPAQDESTLQGTIGALYEMQTWLAEIAGMHEVTLQPAAGAHGEFTGLLLIDAYHQDHRQTQRDQVIVPDTAHGTNPATAGMLNFEVLEIPSKEGQVDLERLKGAVSDRTAALMLTNPNTLGIFERDVAEIAAIVHEAGGLLYYDGANFNAILGKCRPGDMGFDVVHFNLHKTLAVPHGGGGPGSGPVGASEALAPYLPIPMAAYDGTRYYWDTDRPKSVGKVRSWQGSTAAVLRSWSYLKCLGAQGATALTEVAVLNANYLRAALEGTYDLPFPGLRKHEFVLSAQKLKEERNVRALDIGKRLLDYGFYAPTVYFPLLVHEAIMIEPTESEPKEELDRFIAAMKSIATEDPTLVRNAPYHTSVSRVDEVNAARHPRLSFRMEHPPSP